MKAAALGIHLAGQLHIHGPAGVLEATALPGRQGRLVLACLGVSEQPVTREVLADRLWGDGPPKAWERDLSAVVSKLRSALTEAGFDGTRAIVSDGATYQLVDLDDCPVDIRVARRAILMAENAASSAEADDAATLALAVAEQPFLPADSAPWIEEVRRELERLRVRALELLADLRHHRGEHQAAIDLLRRVVNLEPYRESAYRQLMTVQLAAGDRAEAVRTYERVRNVLAEELGIDPSPDTEATYLQALRGEAPVAEAGTPAAATSTEPAVPEIRYARSGRVNIAYQVVGGGPVDLVLVPGWISNIELAWYEPRFARFLRDLAGHCRLILFDKRGTGLSDPIPIDEPPPLEQRMDDVRAVMDDAGSERAVLLGFSEGGSMSLLFAATHPDRTAGLMLWGTWCRQLRDDDFPYGWTREQGMRRLVRPLQQRGAISARWFAPSLADDPEFEAWFQRYGRNSASPGMAIALLRANAAMDLRDVLPSVRVPTVVLHRTDDVLVEVGQGRYLAEHIPGARLVEFPGTDHWPWIGESAPILAEMVAFLEAAARPRPVPQQLLATVLVTRTASAEDLDVLTEDHRGTRAADVGDRTVVRFDGPGRAVEAALLLARSSGAGVGLHTGEIVLRGEEITGVAVDVAIAAADLAAAGEVVATRTIRDLVAGSRHEFADRGQAVVAGDRRWDVLSVRTAVDEPRPSG